MTAHKSVEPEACFQEKLLLYFQKTNNSESYGELTMNQNFIIKQKYLPNKDFIMSLTKELQKAPVNNNAQLLLQEGGTMIIGNCIALQNQKTVAGGIPIVYVPENARVESMQEAIRVAGCSLTQVIQKVPWGITTIEDGKELLYVDIAIGRKFT